MQSYIPLISGSGGALAVLAIGLYLFITGKLHSDAEYQKLADENKDLKAALETERTTNNELARAGGVTNKLIGALIEVATDRHDHPALPRKDAGLTPEDLGLLAVRLPWRRRVREVTTGEPRRHREAEVSRQRQERAREQVIRPLDRLAEQNRFADLIRQSLTEGHGRKA